MLGRTIQHYRIEELLGEGGMGTVYRATDTLLRRSVAVKMLHPHLLRDTTFMERFRNEAVLSAQLNHPNVTTLYNLLQDRTDNLMVMEYINGMTLDKLVKKNGTLSVELAVRIVMQALDGLYHAHQKGILHRDIKPANLMVTQEGIVKLMDFGIARLVGSQRLTRTDRVVGTLEYMAPELLDRVEPSVQSDLYAVGVLLYELLSGKMPFEATTDSTLINQILTKNPIPLRNRITDLPKSLEGVLEKLFQKKPEKRYTSAAELKQALSVIVPPSPINTQIFETRKIPIPATRLAEAHDRKPITGPTVLVQPQATTPKTTSKNLLSNAMSLEGLILISALIVAAVIVGVWIFLIEPSPSSEVVQKDSTQNHKLVVVNPIDTHKAHEEVAILSQKEVKTPPANPPETLKPIAQKPPKQRQPEEIKPDENQPDKPKPEKPAETVPEKPKEEKHEEPKPVRKVTVTLGSEPLAIQFMETVTSDDATGKTVLLQTASSVVIDGYTVITTGARVRGRVTDSRSASDSKKAFLAVRFEAVQAANGEWVPLKYPEYSDKASGQVVFQAGRRVNQVRTTRTTLTVQL